MVEMHGLETPTDLEHACAAHPFVYLLPDLIFDQAQVPRATHAHLFGLEYNLPKPFKYNTAVRTNVIRSSKKLLMNVCDDEQVATVDS